MLFSEDFPSIAPVNFFRLIADCHSLPQERKFPFLNGKNREKYLLPDTSTLCREESFAKVALGWHESGIEAYIQVNVKFSKSVYPEVHLGDSIELFIDPRDVKTSGFNTKFCHHFFFFPEGVDGVFAGEITKFRTEDSHPLCDPADIKVKMKNLEKGYELHIFLPKEILHGYDPMQFTRLGFTYRINRFSGLPQHFSALSDEYQIEQQPSLWSTLKLI